MGNKAMKINPALQAANLIRYIGDRVTESGEPIGQLKPEVFYEEIDSPSAEFAASLLSELCERDFIKTLEIPPTLDGSPVPINVDLTLPGWEKYEAEKRGRISGNYGFLARKFDDTDTDFEVFIREVVKSTVEKELGYGLVDMKDELEAGRIDDIMCIKIRDAAFVIADLTHDNQGAYWEAGYAEGLGKPVVYICEQQKFDDDKTHFDTNHCTTILWSEKESEHDAFKRNLIATLRRSLDQ